MWEVEYGVEYVTYKILRRWDSCDCMLFSKFFYTNLYHKCPDEEPVTVEKRIQNNQKEFGSVSLGEGVVFAMNSKGKCMYQSQKQKKNSWMAAGSLSVWESNPHQENVQLHFGNLHFDIENFEQLFLLYSQLSLQEYIFDFDF